MTILSFMNDLQAKFPHSHTTAEVIAWINEVDRSVFADAEKNFLVANYQRAANVSNISMPTGVEFEDIESISVNGFKYWPSDLRTINNSSRYYFKEDGKLEIRPIPAISDIEYVSGASEITFASNSITTTGDDFVGFVIGDTIKINGCLLAIANNRNAVVTAVSAKVLTVNPSTFSVQTEAAAITIQAPKIKLVYVAKPTDRTIADLALELRIPARFQPIYRYYLMAEISKARKEFGDANNYIIDFNNKVREYEDFYQSRQGIKPEESVVMDGGWGRSATSNFDADIG